MSLGYWLELVFMATVFTVPVVFTVRQLIAWMTR